MGKKELPIYLQIHDQLQAEIEKGTWGVGDRLPSERDLSLQFGVSRMTLRQAIQTLADEGVLERKIGSGTYVAKKRVQEKMIGTTSFSQIMKTQGKVPSSKTTAYFITTASASEAEKLNLAPGEQILRMERIRYADDVPICFEMTSIPYKLIEQADKKAITQSLYETLVESKGLKVGKAVQKVTAITASEKIADYLAIKKGDAVLRLSQTTYFDNGEPFEYVRSQYVGHRFEFILEK